jgi:hypothetical protein
VMGGTSFVPDNAAVNTRGPVFDGPVGLSLPPHIDAVKAAARTIAPMIDRLISLLLPGFVIRTSW